MYQKGYNIHVYQTEFMNFCAGYEDMVVSCRTNRDTGIEPLEYLDLSPAMKAWLALDTFSRLSVLCRGFKYRYNALRQKALGRGYELPPWVLNRFALWAVRGVRALQEIEDDASSAPAGEMFFAHLLFPHHPYVYDPTCKARDPQDWEMNNEEPPLPPNSDASRLRRYGLYLQQVLCIRVRLQDMFDRWRQIGVYDRMLIVIQGDHGSRIWLHTPIAANKDRLVPSDYTDGFSTLFAVKAPGLEAAYDSRMVAIQDLLPAVAGAQPLDRLPASETEPYVLLETQPKVLFEDGTDMLRQPMPEFGDPEGEGKQIQLSPPADPRKRTWQGCGRFVSAVGHQAPGGESGSGLDVSGRRCCRDRVQLTLLERLIARPNTAGAGHGLTGENGDHPDGPCCDAPGSPGQAWSPAALLPARVFASRPGCRAGHHAANACARGCHMACRAATSRAIARSSGRVRIGRRA